MGYWTCWYESVKHFAPKVFHATKHHVHGKHLLSKKIIHHTSNLTLKKVCIYTGGLGVGVGGIGGGLERLMHPHPVVPNDPGILLPPVVGGMPGGYIPDGMVPGIGGGFNPGDYMPGGGGLDGYEVIPPFTGSVIPPSHTFPSVPTIPTIPNKPENVPEPSSVIIFMLAVLVFIFVKHITGNK